MPNVKIRWGQKSTQEEIYKGPDDYSDYAFDTQPEADAFLLGVAEAMDWLDYEIID